MSPCQEQPTSPIAYIKTDHITGRLACISPAEYEQWGKDNAPEDAYVPTYANPIPAAAPADRELIRNLLALMDEVMPQASAGQSAHHNLLGELYQVLGALDAPDNVLDNVSAAIHDEPLPHATLLPFVVSAQSAPAGERDALRAELARWERSYREVHEPALQEAHAYIQELRAELEAARGLLRHASSALGVDGWESLSHEIDTFLTAAPAQPAAQDQGEVQRLRDHVPLYEAVERACGELPNGWTIQLHMENGAGWVELYDDSGCQVDDFPTNNERLDYTLNDAIDAALAASTGQEV